MENGAGSGQKRRKTASPEKAIARGGRALKSGEALELLLSYALKGHDAQGAAVRLMKRFNGLRGVFDASQDELCASGLTESGALLVKLMKEASSLYLKERMMGMDAVVHRKHVLDYLTLTLSGERIEKFIAIYLNSRNEVVSVDVLHEGTINQTVVYPRKAIEKAFMYRAGGVIFVHNHPSGDATPSGMDRQLARTLDHAAEAVDLVVVDHMIIGKNRHFSAREHGWMTGQASRA